MAIFIFWTDKRWFERGANTMNDQCWTEVVAWTSYQPFTLQQLRSLTSGTLNGSHDDGCGQMAYRRFCTLPPGSHGGKLQKRVFVNVRRSFLNRKLFFLTYIHDIRTLLDYAFFLVCGIKTKTQYTTWKCVRYLLLSNKYWKWVRSPQVLKVRATEEAGCLSILFGFYRERNIVKLHMRLIQSASSPLCVIPTLSSWAASVIPDVVASYFSTDFIIALFHLINQ